MSKDNKKYKEREKSIKDKFPTLESLMFENEKAKQNYVRKQKYKKKD